MGLIMGLGNTEHIRHYSRKIVRELGFLNKFPKNEDISASQIHILVELGKYGKLTGAQLCENLQLDKSTISRTTKILEEKNWIQTEESSEDSRYKYYSLTKSGFARLNLSNVRARQLVNQALSNITDDQKMKVMEGLKIYADALEKSRTPTWTVEKFNTNISVGDIRYLVSQVQAKEFDIKITETLNKSLDHIETFYRDSKDNVNFWCAIAQGQVIGTIGLHQLSDHRAELNKFFIRKDYRGLGISHGLLSCLLEQSTALKIKEIYLGTTDRYHAAHRFYDKNGFERIDQKDLPKTFQICEVDTIFYRYTFE
jgi:DNA-binding MarR family transcriptional regulator/N-acetylglutamate synthase-like GNAT family acetyltransferase